MAWGVPSWELPGAIIHAVGGRLQVQFLQLDSAGVRAMSDLLKATKPHGRRFLAAQIVVDYRGALDALDALVDSYGIENLHITPQAEAALIALGAGERESEQISEAEERPSPRQQPTDPRTEAYRILHLDPDAPMEVVKAAYRALSARWHPDHEHGDAERMKVINRAYDLLCGK